MVSKRVQAGFKKHSSGFLTKARNKFRERHDGRRVLYYCENCRIKDGLDQSWGLVYTICSFCGRKTRCYHGNYGVKSRGKTVAKAKTPWYWQRGSAWWKDHGKKKK